MSLEGQRDVGTFTFQVQLHSNGVIKFVYKQVAIPIPEINTARHVVKVGISDAYQEWNVSRVYPNFVAYDTINPDISRIASNTAYIFTPATTCGSRRSCGSCISHSDKCVWCSALMRCSTREGVDSHHKLWTQYGCPASAVGDCVGIPEVDPTTHISQTHSSTPPPNPTLHFASEFIIPQEFETQSNNAIETAHPNNRNDYDNSQSASRAGGPDTSMTIITTISITAVCIAAILVISALLILRLKLRRGGGILSPVKHESENGVKSHPCNEHCTRTLIEHSNGNGAVPLHQQQFLSDV